MRLERVMDPAALRAFLHGDDGTRLYERGDLDPAFFGDCEYVGGMEGDRLVALFVSFLPPEPRVCQFMGGEDADLALLELAHRTWLPPRCYFHVHPRLALWLEARGLLSNQQPHDRMMLVGEAWREVGALGQARPVTDAAKLGRFYEDAYPGNTFMAGELGRARFMGWFDEAGELVAAAGTHVVSREGAVAALGNIATHPEHRGQGFGAAVTAALLGALEGEGVTSVGLNVRSDNVAAIACYRKLGFERVMTFVEADYER